MTSTLLVLLIVGVVMQIWMLATLTAEIRQFRIVAHSYMMEMSQRQESMRGALQEMESCGNESLYELRNISGRVDQINARSRQHFPTDAEFDRDVATLAGPIGHSTKAPPE